MHKSADWFGCERKNTYAISQKQSFITPDFILFFARRFSGPTFEYKNALMLSAFSDQIKA
jgi:hypothetical protein